MILNQRFQHTLHDLRRIYTNKLTKTSLAYHG